MTFEKYFGDLRSWKGKDLKSLFPTIYRLSQYEGYEEKVLPYLERLLQDKILTVYDSRNFTTLRELLSVGKFRYKDHIHTSRQGLENVHHSGLEHLRVSSLREDLIPQWNTVKRLGITGGGQLPTDPEAFPFLEELSLSQKHVHGLVEFLQNHTLSSIYLPGLHTGYVPEVVAGIEKVFYHTIEQTPFRCHWEGTRILGLREAFVSRNDFTQPSIEELHLRFQSEYVTELYNRCPNVKSMELYACSGELNLSAPLEKLELIESGNFIVSGDVEVDEVFMHLSGGVAWGEDVRIRKLTISDPAGYKNFPHVQELVLKGVFSVNDLPSSVEKLTCKIGSNLRTMSALIDRFGNNVTFIS